MRHFWPITAVGKLGYELMKKLALILESYTNYVEGFFFSCSKFDLFLNFVQNFKFFLIQCKKNVYLATKRGRQVFTNYTNCTVIELIRIVSLEARYCPIMRERIN